MAVFDGTAYGEYSPGAVIYGARPITVCCWVKRASAVLVNGLYGFSDDNPPILDSAAVRYHNSSGAAIESGGSRFAQGASLGDNVWTSLVGVFTDADLKLYTDGVLSATDATPLGVAGWRSIMAGAENADVPAAFLIGKMVHGSIHTAEFSSLDAQHHAAGWSANRLPSPWVWHKLESNGEDSVGSRHLTLTNVTFDSDFPDIDYGSSSVIGAEKRSSRQASRRVSRRSNERWPA